jgi:hypothetical protein
MGRGLLETFELFERPEVFCPVVLGKCKEQVWLHNGGKKAFLENSVATSY